MLGHGRRMTRNPPWFGGSARPCLSTTSAMMPGSGLVAEPGFVGTAPGMGEIMIAPVSVCHHVSTIGQRSRPIFLRYHIHASGLIGSPTVPSNLKLERSCFAGHMSPHLTNERMAVGAV